MKNIVIIHKKKYVTYSKFSLFHILLSLHFHMHVFHYSRLSGTLLASWNSIMAWLISCSLGSSSLPLFFMRCLMMCFMVSTELTELGGDIFIAFGSFILCVMLYSQLLLLLGTECIGVVDGFSLHWTFYMLIQKYLLL